MKSREEILGVIAYHKAQIEIDQTEHDRISGAIRIALTSGDCDSPQFRTQFRYAEELRQRVIESQSVVKTLQWVIASDWELK